MKRKYQKTVLVSNKRYKYLFRKMLDKDLIRRAYYKMRIGKTKRKKIQIIDADLDNYVDKMFEMLMNTFLGKEGGFYPPKHEPTTINEHGKERQIYVPDIMEQWVHHIIMQVMAPIFFKRFHYDSFGSVPKKGLHKGKDKFLKYQHKYKYAYKMDIRHFYASIRHDILRRELSLFVDDRKMIDFIMLCFIHFKKGLPLGFYLSQWLSNVILTRLDWFIESQGVRHIRYVDDIIIFCDNKKKLCHIAKLVRLFLGRELRLKVKGNSKLIYLKHEKISFLGFVFDGVTTRLRSHIKRFILHTIHRIRKAKEHKLPIWIKDARRILSSLGWIEHADAYMMYLSHIKPYIQIKQLKKIVSKHDKKERLLYDSLDINRTGSRTTSA